MKPGIINLSAVVLFLSLAITQCSKDDKSLNFFTIDQDIEFGQTLDEEIMNNPDQYPVLDKNDYPDAYQHIERIRDNILASGQLNYADRFPWEVKIIHDSVLNAFAAPGGYMYFYSGIIEFLDNEAQFAGVMAHEMAHCDRRHSTDRLTKEYGFSILLGILLGDNPGQLAQIAAGLAQGLTSLAFSRENEYEADEYAIKYLKETEYNPCSLGDFFGKMQLQVGSETRPPVFLSTHPSPDDRLEKIQEHCSGSSGELFPARYQDFQNSLPGFD